MASVQAVGFFAGELKSCFVNPPMLQGVVGGAEILPNFTIKLEGGSELLLGWALSHALWAIPSIMLQCWLC